MHHSYGQENVPFKRLLVYFSREEVDSVQLLKVLEKGTGVYKPDQREKQVVHRMLDDLLKEQDDPQAYHEGLYPYPVKHGLTDHCQKHSDTGEAGKAQPDNRCNQLYPPELPGGYIHRPAGPDVLCESLLPVQGVQALYQQHHYPVCGMLHGS